MRSVILDEMTREDVRRLAPDATVVIPTGSTEQHGPHLPVMTDSVIATEVCRRAAEIAQAEIPIAVTPTVAFGYSPEHLPQPGVLSLSTTTLIQVLRELGESLYMSGFRRIAIINSHGPNDELIRVAARDLSNSLPVSTATASYWTIAWRAMYTEAGTGELGWIPGHAGRFETAIMLALRPDLVDRTPLPPAGDEDEGVAPEQIHRPLIRWAGVRRGIGPGYTGSPDDGTAEDGQRYLDVITRAVAGFLIGFHRGHPRDEQEGVHAG